MTFPTHRLKSGGAPRSISVSGAFFALCMGVALSGCGKKPAEEEPVVRPIQMLTVGGEGTARTLEFPGTVSAAQQVDLSFEVPGRIIEFPVTEGTSVTEINLLARLDPRDYKTRLANAESALAEAEAQLAAMKKGRPEDVAAAQEQLQAAEAKYRDAKTQLERQQNLFKAGVISKSELDRAQTIHDVAQAGLNTAEQELKRVSAGARKEDIEAQVARIEGLKQNRKEAEDALANTELYPPFQGFVSRKIVDNFTNVQAKQPIVSLQDISHLEIEINIPERFAVRGDKRRSLDEVNNRAKPRIEMSSVPGHFIAAKLTEISTDADPVARTYKATLQFDRPSTPLVLPGMTAKVIANVAGEQNGSTAISIPSHAAVGDNSGGYFVWVIDPATMKVRRRPVSVGDLAGSEARVTSGLSPGDTIAVSGVHSLREGMQVRRLND